MMPAMLAATRGWPNPTPKAQGEIEYLLSYIENSGCEFYRNGTWHDSKAAQAHLRDKYNYLLARDLIQTTEDFITLAATESSFSGLAYEARCSGGQPIPSKQWLGDELARYRKFKSTAVELNRPS
jgi:hypothetical protein